MFSKKLLAILITCLTSGITLAHADDAFTTPAPVAAPLAGASFASSGSLFSGPYAGFKVGANVSNASGAYSKPTHTTVFPGFTLGYGFDVGSLMIGAEAFADLHHGSATFKDGGFDAKIGMPIGQIMPYARMGLTLDWPAARPHWGVGVEYAVTRNLGVAAEWTGDHSNSKNTNWNNNSFTLGMHYYFR
ncbi:porin family protein [Paraburkholderia bannensis]|uniref:porin family protein n=1 Tax=Paraburkholderia bannensis TaxID=765414 RepID=UPI000A88B75A|nr:porin family protein [Paraburkholderia bannensis]